MDSVGLLLTGRWKKKINKIFYDYSCCAEYGGENVFDVI